ncbi:MAG: enoyl-CoA hydratase-related protein, partial [Xanthomonadales bacterium]|nr:enoyl-CoA hydratase-related protein [Xanthomonadales bacterium]
MNEHIAIERDAGILVIRIERPEKKNALTAAMYGAMAEAMKGAAADPEIKVILFAGSGGTFTAGNDLRDFLENPPRSEDSPVNRFIAELVRSDLPLVAAVDGIAVGIGTTMLLHCDLVYAADNAAFSLPFVNLGLCPEAGASLLL